MAILTVGIDLAKNVFAVHGVDDVGKVVHKRPAVPRIKLAELVASFSPCLIGVEAELGHEQSGGLFMPGEGPSLWLGAACKAARARILGSALPGARSHGAADGAQARDALSDVGQAGQ